MAWGRGSQARLGLRGGRRARTDRRVRELRATWRNPPRPRRVGAVYALYLGRSVLGRGIGRALLERATEGLRDAGWKRAVLWVLETNERARRFYERAGWSWDGTTSAHRFDRAELPIVRYAADL
ncbi:MAG: GNAT family N-acetyltransferase [Actinomycetota bacterium]